MNERLLIPKTGNAEVPLDGKYVLISHNTTKDLYLSVDGGQTFQNTGQTLLGYGAARISDDGQFMRVVNQSSFSSSGNYIMGSNDYGLTWVNAYTLARPWRAIHMSADGRYQFATIGSGTSSNRIYYSSNYGMSWGYKYFSQAKPNSYMGGSDSGQYLLVATYGVYPTKSINYGISWADQTGMSTFDSYGVASSASGQYMINISRSGSPYSPWCTTNYGANWSQLTAIALTLGSSPEISRSGQYWTVVDGDDIYVSGNYGVSWTEKSGSYPSVGKICIAQDESKWYLNGKDGNLYKSSNYGGTWNPINIGFQYRILNINRSAT